MSRFPLTVGLTKITVPQDTPFDKPSTIAKWQLSQVQFAKDAGGKLYYQRGGVFIPGGEEFSAELTIRLLESIKHDKSWSAKNSAGIIEYIRIGAPLLWATPPLDRINLLNGILDVNTLILEPHSPDYLSAIQLPVTYDHEATCPAWDRFLAQVLPTDAMELLFEVFAWAMIPDRSIQKVLILCGTGCNGKSTLLKGVINFLGANNISSIAWQTLEGNRFSKVALLNKLANISPDLPNKTLESTSVMKAITGGDRIDAEYKFGKQFSFDPIAKLIFSANEIPRSSDFSEGFYRRLLIIPFDHLFEEDPAVGRKLDSDLGDPVELSGMLNKALETLPRLRKKGFTIPPSTRASLRELRSNTDPTAAWLQAELDEDSTAFLPKELLYDAYRKEAKGKQLPMLLAPQFGKIVKSVFDVVDKQRTIGGKQKTWGYLGIRFREGSIPDIQSRSSSAFDEGKI